jgi:hypothetical protein
MAMLEFSDTCMFAIGYYILDNQVRFRNCIIHQIQIRSEDLSLKDGRFVEMLLCKYKFLSSKIVNPRNRDTQIFQNPRFTPKFWTSKGCREANPVQKSHNSEVTFSLRSYVVIYACSF